MSEPGTRKALEFGGAATYRIVVRGRIDERLLERVSGLRVTTGAPEAPVPEVILVGLFQDQAELRGLLDTVQGLGLPIVSVERIREERG